FMFRIIVYSVVSFIFFFQAEDGIRDFHVTGVQTCALPISATQERTPPEGDATGSTAPLQLPAQDSNLACSRASTGCAPASACEAGGGGSPLRTTWTHLTPPEPEAGGLTGT